MRQRLQARELHAGKQYESLIADVREKAQTVESAQIDRRFLEQQLTAKRELAIMDKLAESPSNQATGAGQGRFRSWKLAKSSQARRT